MLCNVCLFLGLTNSSDGKLIGDNPELGCNFHKHSWCLHQPKIYLSQCVIGICVITVAYSSSLLLCPTIFSKVLGPWPQVYSYIWDGNGDSTQTVYSLNAVF